MFEEVVNPAFHSGSMGLDTKLFGTTTPVNILANLQHLYGKLSYQELDAALLSLNDPMKQMQLVELMLRGIGEVQIFLLANPDKCCALSEPNLISYALIKLTKTASYAERGAK